jgi:hypothetical protein
MKRERDKRQTFFFPFFFFFFLPPLFPSEGLVLPDAGELSLVVAAVEVLEPDAEADADAEEEAEAEVVAGAGALVTAAVVLAGAEVEAGAELEVEVEAGAAAEVEDPDEEAEADGAVAGAALSTAGPVLRLAELGISSIFLEATGEPAPAAFRTWLGGLGASSSSPFSSSAG